MMTGSIERREASDSELLHRFIHDHDEGAFTALVHRHGPTVLGVCRRVLSDPNDADDAFQATFLVLVRKASSMTNPGLLANWLYGVAYRTALEARTQAARRRARERQVPPMPPQEPTPEVIWSDLRPVLDEEVSRLPEKYRAPFVLCYLEGRTNEEAAELLGCPRGTVLSRLAWARERLRYRLSRRGLTLSAGLFASLLSLNEVSAAVSPALTAGTARAAMSVALGESAAVSVPVVSLMEGVLKAMWMTKLKAWAAVLVAFAVLGTAGLFTYHALAAEGKDAKQAKKGKTHLDRLQGTWIIISADHGGKKVSFEEGKQPTFTVKGDKATLKMDGQTQNATLTLDSTKTPKQIDMAVDEGGKTETHLGIYTLEGDTFTMCKSHPPQARPSKFETKQGERWPALVVMKRKSK
jgi:RNA polymerase sigma factor (sigma-70 family)